jgi:RimJ/RimL family protein N-acetyltransferase
MIERNEGSVPILAHGAVYLRPAERADLPTFVRWFGDDRTSTTLSARAPMSLAGEERWFEHMLEQQGSDSWFFVICLRSDDRPVGTVGLFALDTTNGSAGLGVSVGDPADTGKGHGSDAIHALLAFGFGRLRLERIWLDVYDHNVGARRLYERLGFVHEATMRHAFWRDDRWVDDHRMALLADEWRAIRDRTREAAPGTVGA